MGKKINKLDKITSVDAASGGMAFETKKPEGPTRNAEGAKHEAPLRKGEVAKLTR